MKVKNYQEELVLNTINLVLEDRRDVNLDDMLIQDVAAYTLNRIPPKYIMSERGFTRLASEYWLDNGSEQGITSLVELVLLINKAIDLVTSRRQGGEEEKGFTSQMNVAPGFGRIEYWHNFPQFIGRVLDGSTKEPIYGIEVTLFIDDKISRSAEPGWLNPYHTNFGTKGFYSFWPGPLRNRAESKKVTIRIAFAHSDYLESSAERQILTVGDFQQNNTINVDDIFNIGTAYLQPK